MQIDIDGLVQHLSHLRKNQGEEAYRQSIENLARGIMGTEDGVGFIGKIAERLKDTSLDMDRLKAEAEAQKAARDQAEAAAGAAGVKDPQQAFLGALQQQMPNLKTQAHFDLVQTAFEALTVYMNSSFGGDHETASKTREALNQVMDLASQVKDIDDQLHETPEATSNRDFVEPPREFTEQDTANGLLADLEGIESRERLNQWYSANRSTLDGVTDRTTRNSLFDAIRRKKAQLAN